MGLFIDISGQKFGKLTALAPIDRKHKGNYYWRCKCDCGKEAFVPSGRLRYGGAKSCGCANPARIARHSEASIRTTEYLAWSSMKSRCENSSHKSFKRYGARGIKVCSRWLAYENFLGDMGRRPSSKHSLDRIDNNGNYEPKNCRWADKKTQSNNTRVSLSLKYELKKPLVDLCREHGIKVKTFHMRIKNGWTVFDALNIPVGSKR